MQWGAEALPLAWGLLISLLVCERAFTLAKNITFMCFLDIKEQISKPSLGDKK